MTEKKQESPTRNEIIIRDAIIRSLRLDGSMSPKEIADKGELPYKTVLRMYDEMRSDGTILIRALFDPAKVNKAIVGFTLIKCQPSILGRDIDWVANELKRNREIDEVHYLIGEWDLIIKFRVPDMKEYHRLVTQEILRTPGIFNAAGWISMKTYKEEPKYEVR